MLCDSKKLFEVTILNGENARYGTYFIAADSLEECLKAIKDKWGENSEVSDLKMYRNFFIKV